MSPSHHVSQISPTRSAARVAAEREAVDAQRGADGRRGGQARQRREYEEARGVGEDVAAARPALDQPDAQERLEGIADGDAQRRPDRSRRRHVHEERADEDRRPQPGSVQEHRRQRDTGGRPYRRRAGVNERQRAARAWRRRSRRRRVPAARTGAEAATGPPRGEPPRRAPGASDSPIGNPRHGRHAFEASGAHWPTLQFDDASRRSGDRPIRPRKSVRGRLGGITDARAASPRAHASRIGSRHSPSRRRTPERTPPARRDPRRRPMSGRRVDPDGAGEARIAEGAPAIGDQKGSCLVLGNHRSGAGPWASGNAATSTPRSVPSRLARRKGLASARRTRPWARSSNLT